MRYNEAVNNLLENIKTDYAKWTTWEEGIERFNNGIRTEDGRKYTKVIQGNSVWGFIAKADGVVKGLPCKKGVVLSMFRAWTNAIVNYKYTDTGEQVLLDTPEVISFHR